MINIYFLWMIDIDLNFPIVNPNYMTNDTAPWQRQTIVIVALTIHVAVEREDTSDKISNGQLELIIQFDSLREAFS